MEFCLSERGSRKLIFEGHIFHKNKTLTNGNTYWECSERRSGNGCKVKVLLDPGENLLNQSGQHTHLPNPERVEAGKLRSTMKRHARISYARTNVIVSAGMGGSTDGVLANLPRLETMRRDVRRQRQAYQNLPEIPNPDDFLFQIQHPYDETTTGEMFLQYDNHREDRILIFGTRESLNFLENSSHWFMDGTFSTVPPQFTQLYTVHGLNHHRNVVGAYCLLPNKREHTYQEMLNQVRALTNGANPESVMIDFEQSMIHAWEQVYPLVPIKGCLFHLCKNIYRHVQSEGLAQQYMDDEEFRANIRMIGALSFVPIADTIVAFDELSNHAGNQEQVILDYFESTYIGEMRRGRRLAPRFPHTMWNMNGRVQDDLPRTNNNLEGWHNRFSGAFTHRHANIWKFITVLKNDSTLNHHIMMQVLIGAAVPPQRHVYQEINQRIVTLVTNYRNDNILEFLRGISYNLA